MADGSATRRARLPRSGELLAHEAAHLRAVRAADLGGLRGYEVRVAGRRLKLVRGTSTTIPRARAAGRRIEVLALDTGGNRGPAAAVRGPRR